MPKRKGRAKGKLLSIRFSKNKFTKKQSQKWLKKHNQKGRLTSSSKNQWRFKQAEEKGYPRKRTKAFGEETGIQALFGFRGKPPTNK